MKKSIYISKLIRSILITIFVFWVFMQNQNYKLFILPFFICSVAVVFKNLFLILEKHKLVDLFNKIYMISFLLFWFGFLIYAGYNSIIKKTYSLLIFSIPFWIIGINLVKKNFFKSNNLKHKSKF